MSWYFCGIFTFSWTCLQNRRVWERLSWESWNWK